MKKINLEWYAFIYDINKDELTYINVLCVITDDVIKRLKKMKSYEEVKECIKRALMCRFWSRCEYEVIVTDLMYDPDKDNNFKIDVWYQLEPNLDRISEYVIRKLNLKV